MKRCLAWLENACVLAGVPVIGWRGAICGAKLMQVSWSTPKTLRVPKKVQTLVPFEAHLPPSGSKFARLLALTVLRTSCCQKYKNIVLICNHGICHCLLCI